MKMREEKERKRQQRVEEDKEKTGRRPEGSEEGIEKVLRDSRTRRRALPSHAPEITSINPNWYMHFVYILCYARCCASHFTCIIFMYPLSSLKISANLYMHLGLPIVQMNNDDDNGSG